MSPLLFGLYIDRLEKVVEDRLQSLNRVESREYV
jgi:hypothetical protein